MADTADAKLPAVRPELDVEVLANLLIETAVAAIDGMRGAETPEAAGEAAMPVLASLGSLFLDYEAAPEARYIDLPSDWTLAGMIARVVPVLTEDEAFASAPGLGENPEETVFLMVHKFMRDMTDDYYELAEAGRIDPEGDLSDFVKEPAVQLDVMTWASLMLGCGGTISGEE